MGQFDRWAGKKIRSAKRAKLQKAKSQGQPNLNLGRQFPTQTNLSAQYDSDGNPIHSEPRGYTSFGGH